MRITTRTAAAIAAATLVLAGCGSDDEPAPDVPIVEEPTDDAAAEPDDEPAPDAPIVEEPIDDAAAEPDDDDAAAEPDDEPAPDATDAGDDDGQADAGGGEVDFDRTDAQRSASSLLGIEEDAVTEGDALRITRRGDEEFPGTMDLRPGRQNIEIDEVDGQWVISRVVVEVPEGEDPIELELEEG